MIKPNKILFYLIIGGAISSCNTPPAVCQYEVVNLTKAPIYIGYATIDSDSFSIKSVETNQSVTFFTTENKNIGKCAKSKCAQIDSAYSFRKLIIYPDSFAHTYSLFLDHKPQHHREIFDMKSGLYKLVTEQYFRESQRINFYILPHKIK